MKLFLKITLAVFVSAIIAIVVIGYKQYSVPSSAEMVAFFVSNRDGFEQKNREILSALDQQEQIDTGADSQLGYRWVEIEPLDSLASNNEPIVVRYYTHVSGIGVGSFGTGIAHIEAGYEVETFASLEAVIAAAKGVSGFIGYSKISANWYSFFWNSN